MKQHGLYKYIYQNQIIYIGKSNSNIYNRICGHKKEKKFKPYIEQGVEIYTCDLPNKTETDLLERALINQYKPILNEIDNKAGFSSLIEVKEPEWIIFDENKYKNKTPKEALLPFPEEAIETSYIGIEKDYNNHDILIYAPYGRVEIPGHKLCPEELLSHDYAYYTSLEIRPINGKSKLEYKSNEIIDGLKSLCKLLLYSDQYIYNSKFDSNELSDIHNYILSFIFVRIKSGIDIYGRQLVSCGVFGKEHNRYLIDINAFLFIWIVFNRYKLSLDDALRIYFKKNPNIREIDILEILELKDLNKRYNKKTLARQIIENREMIKMCLNENGNVEQLFAKRPFNE